jgi:hypothetical protein
MKTTDLNIAQLSETALKLLIKNCELKIKQCQADLDDYELYVACQRDLLERRLQKSSSTTFKMVM